jgi:hypothetical protein
LKGEVNNMDAVKFLKAKARMCESYSITKCPECSLHKQNNGEDINCIDFIKQYPDKAVEFVGVWYDEHPEKTYMQDFLEKFPDAPLDKGGLMPCACRKYIYGGMCPTGLCTDCWNESMEE